MDISYFYLKFAEYNADWLVVNLILWILLLTAIAALVFKPEEKISEVFIKASLALVFLWNGLVFFPFYMTQSAFAGTVPMILAGILMAADIFRNQIKILVPSSGMFRYITAVWIIWALGLYTIAGWLKGHNYPCSPLPTAPCPLTILGIALLSVALPALKEKRVHFNIIFAMLIWWSLYAGIGSSVIYGFYLDLTLLAAGIYGIFMFRQAVKKPGISKY